MKRHDYSEISKTDISNAIDFWVHKSRDRTVMRRVLLDGICYEPLAEELGLSVSTIKRIVYKHEYSIYVHAKK